MRWLGAILVVVILVFLAFPDSTQAVINQCLDVEDSIDAATRKVQSQKEEHEKKFSAVNRRLVQVGNALVREGVATDSLEEKRKEFEQKTEAFLESYRSFESKAKEARSAACNQSEAEFKKKLSSARSELGTVRTKAQDVYRQYQTAIVPELRKAR